MRVKKEYETRSFKHLIAACAFLICSALAGYAAQFGDYTYEESVAAIEITDYPEDATGEVIIPSEIVGKPVTIIGDRAFYRCARLTSVTIPDSVTRIGEWAFYGCTRLTSLTIPDSVTLILENAFGSCTSLAAITVDTANPTYSSLDGVLFNKNKTGLHQFPIGKAGETYTIPDSVTNIGPYAFRGCSSLTSVTIPNSVTSIWDYAFNGCTSLTSVTIPDSVTSIGDNAFGNCTSLTSVTIPNNVTSISRSAFYYCANLTSVTIPDRVTVIEGSAFYGCTNLTSVTIPDSVTAIESLAFGTCTNLTSVAIPDSVTSVGDRAFLRCTGLTSVTIPVSVTSFGTSVFGFCTSLTAITVDAANPTYSSLDGVLFNKNQTGLGQYPCGKAGVYPIPDSVVSIGERAFEGSTGLTNVTIPDSVTNIGRGAFADCTSLSSITIPDSVVSLESGAFANCTNLTSVTIPNSVTSIGDSAFWECASLTSVTIPDSVTSISYSAFIRCTSLTSVTIPASVTEIKPAAFTGCTNLTAITVDAANPVYSSLDGALFNKSQTTLIQCPGAKAGDYTIPDSVTSIGPTAVAGCTSLTSITIPDSVTSIGDYAFSGPSSLTSVTIPFGVTSIGRNAFQNCANLTSVTIPESVTSIGSGAFMNCTSLTSVTIPDSVTSIERRLFEGCTNLISVTIHNSVTSIGDSAFGNCTSLTAITVDAGNNAYSSLDGVLFDKNQTTLMQYPGGKAGAYTIPDSVIVIEDQAFGKCTSLTAITVDAANPTYSSLDGVLFDKNQTALMQYPGGKAGAYTIPDSVISIEYGAFQNCTGLTSVTIPDSVTSRWVSLFRACTNLTAFTVDAANPAYSSLDGVVFDKSQKTLIQCPGGKAGAYTVPDSVTSIGYPAFGSCTSLTSVTIPESVTSINPYAFWNCTSLTSVYFEGNAPLGDSSVFEGADTATVYYLAGTTGWGATYGGRPTVMLNGPPDPLIGGIPVNGSEGWFVSEWFGVYYTDLAPWLYHSEHGFVYRDPGSSNMSTYFYDLAMGAWWWTNQPMYPFLCAFNPPADNAGTDIEAEWLWYFEETKTPRVFSIVTGEHAGEALFFGP